MPHPRADVAQKLKELLVESSPLIEAYTREVCPACTDVCCREQHGVFRERDIIYLAALGAEVLHGDARGAPEAPCRHLGAAGCARPRWLRPFKCTWYFCGPLLTALDSGPQKKARILSQTLQEMILLYDHLAK